MFKGFTLDDNIFNEMITNLETNFEKVVNIGENTWDLLIFEVGLPGLNSTFFNLFTDS